ncbi:MAG TPA: rod shape-determining protein MreC [Acidimicrobiia bacterium]
MTSRERYGRALPTLITLIVIGVMLMTFDIRSEGQGVVGVLRQGAQTLLAPLQKAASYAVTPVVNLVDSVTDVARLREENAALRREIQELAAEINASRDATVRLAELEAIFGMTPTGVDIGRTVANVIGRVGVTVDEALIIDKGTTDGVAVGQPVVDSQNYVVGSVASVTASSATVVPILSARQGMTVLVGQAEGTLLPQTGSDLMRLEIFGAREPVLAGTSVVTSSGSLRFPAGWLVGEVVEDVQPSVDVITVPVRPYSSPAALRVVVVLAWPPDPVTASAPPTTTTLPETSTTTLPEGSTTTLPEDEE